MPELLTYVQSECDSFFDSIVESVSSILLEEYPELFSNLCDEIIGSEDD